MDTKKSSLEGTVFLFAMVFTVLSISAYSVSVLFGIAPMFRTPLPWIVLLVLSVAGVVLARYRRHT